MIYNYKEANIPGVYELFPPVFKDNRGSITKIYHKDSFESLKLPCDFGETLVTKNNNKGIVRGFHFQYPPYAQEKLIHCISGSIKNVVLDIRKGSPTYLQTEIFELSEDKPNVLYLPKGIANAYLICRDNTVIIYNLTSKYMPDYDGGIRWDSVGADFGVGDYVVSEKDLRLPILGDFDSPFDFFKDDYN